MRVGLDGLLQRLFHLEGVAKRIVGLGSQEIQTGVVGVLRQLFLDQRAGGAEILRLAFQR